MVYDDMMKEVNSYDVKSIKGLNNLSEADIAFQKHFDNWLKTNSEKELAYIWMFVNRACRANILQRQVNIRKRDHNDAFAFEDVDNKIDEATAWVMSSILRKKNRPIKLSAMVYEFCVYPLYNNQAKLERMTNDVDTNDCENNVLDIFSSEEDKMKYNPEIQFFSKL